MVVRECSKLKPGDFFVCHDGSQLIYMRVDESASSLVIKKNEKDLVPCLCVSGDKDTVGRLFHSGKDTKMVMSVASIDAESDIFPASKIHGFACYEKIGEIVVASTMYVNDTLRGAAGRVVFTSSGKAICVGNDEEMVQLEVSFKPMRPEDEKPEPEPILHKSWVDMYVLGVDDAYSSASYGGKLITYVAKELSE